MVDWSKISLDLGNRIKDIITGEGEDREEATLNKPKEYDELAKLLSGKGDVKLEGEEKEFVEVC